MELLLWLLLNHGYSSSVVDCGSDEVLLLYTGHAGHRVVLGQRALAAPWCRLVFELAATVHPPAERQEEVHASRPSDAMAQFPIDQVLPCEHQQAQPHGHQQHVEHPRHVVNVQLTAHHLDLVVVADPGQPESLQHVDLIVSHQLQQSQVQWSFPARVFVQRDTVSGRGKHLS